MCNVFFVFKVSFVLFISVPLRFQSNIYDIIIIIVRLQSRLQISRNYPKPPGPPLPPQGPEN